MEFYFEDYLPLFMFAALGILLFSGYPVAFVLAGVGLAFGFIGMYFDVFQFIMFFNLTSRIWGGIHPRVDDIPGRKMGQLIGPQAWEKAQTYWLPPDLCPWDMNEDGTVDGLDLNVVLGAWG